MKRDKWAVRVGMYVDRRKWRRVEPEREVVGNVKMRKQRKGQVRRGVEMGCFVSSRRYLPILCFGDEEMIFFPNSDLNLTSFKI